MRSAVLALSMLALAPACGDSGPEVGEPLPNIELSGYVRNEPDGLANEAMLENVTFADVRDSSDEAYAVVHVSGFTCPNCKKAIQNLVGRYASLREKAIFIELLGEGGSHSSQAGQNHLDAWIESYDIPFTTLRDPDGVGQRIVDRVGPRETTFVVSLASLKVVERSDDLDDIYSKLGRL